MNDLRILIVDDEEAVARIFARALGSITGYSAAVAHSAEEAIELLENQACDVVITDIVMPGASGLLPSTASRAGPMVVMPKARSPV